jgi:hypothetical protein
MDEAPEVLARALRHIQPDERGRFLRAMLAHTAASLTLLEGERATCEAVYRLGDAVVGCAGA